MSSSEPAHDRSALPSASALRDPILRALRSLGGQGANEEIEKLVVEELEVSAELLAIRHDPYVGTRTEIAYRMAWARTRLQKEGLIRRVGPKLWAVVTPST